MVDHNPKVIRNKKVLTIITKRKITEIYSTYAIPVPISQIEKENGKRRKLKLCCRLGILSETKKRSKQSESMKY